MMTVDPRTRRLSRNELMAVEKSLFEMTRKQKGQDSPVHISMPEGLVFWDSVGQLLQHMETELAETVRDEGMNAKAQLLSRRLGVARTCVRDLTRMRLLAFTRHAVMSNLLSDEQGGPGLGRVEWEVVGNIRTVVPIVVDVFVVADSVAVGVIPLGVV